MLRLPRLFLLAAAVVATLASLHGLPGPPAVAAAADRPLPDFPATADWLNGPPLHRADLAGQVALVEVWTYDCINCRNSLPWLKTLPAHYAGRPFRLIGVHTPEFDFERVAANVADQVRRLGITWPVLLDPDSTYWTALDNRYWPAFYLVDATGRIRQTAIGEIHPGEPSALRLEAAIDAALAEAAATPAKHAP